MAGIFPRGGLPPGVDNSGVPLTNEPGVGCAALYYNESCPQKIDTRAINALLSEFVVIVNSCPEIRYDCARRDNLLRAIQCLLEAYSICALPELTQAEVDSATSVTLAACVDGVDVRVPVPSTTPPPPPPPASGIAFTLTGPAGTFGDVGEWYTFGTGIGGAGTQASPFQSTSMPSNFTNAYRIVGAVADGMGGQQWIFMSPTGTLP